MKEILLSMLKDMSNYHRNTCDLMPHYVSERLDLSFKEYNKELQQSIQYLTRKHEKSIIKRMNKLDGKSN